MIGKVHSLESFGTVDGPGTRFVVFLKGCNLRCLYCHNPDTWKQEGAMEMTPEEILEKYEKVKEFITGGITVSGGEPLLQIEFLIKLFKEAKRRGIHTCLDTSGSTFQKNNSLKIKSFNELIKYTDLVLLDIKEINPKKHFELTQWNLKPILDFAQFLSDNNIDMWVRYVLLPDLLAEKERLIELGKKLKKYKNIIGLEVLPYHEMGIVKYENLGMKYPLEGVRSTTKEEARLARSLILFGLKS